jgi:pimeloyl-ACP methyl ester carboxylesterase
VENIRRYRLLTTVVRRIGLWPVRGKTASIMMGKSILTDTSRRDELKRYVDLMSRRGDIWRAVNGVIDRAGIHSELSRISIPTLVIVGDEDTATPPPRAEKITAAITGAKLVRIPRAGHSSPVEEPAAVTSALSEFLISLSS